MLSSLVFQSEELLHLGLYSQRERARPSISRYLESIGCLVRIYLGWYTPICYTLNLGRASDDFKDLLLRHSLKWIGADYSGIFHRSNFLGRSRTRRSSARGLGGGVTSDRRRASRENWSFFVILPRCSLPFPF